MRNLGALSNLLCRSFCTRTSNDILVYNLKTKMKEPLKYKKLLTWYMCGPTVYDSTHIGHARLVSVHFKICLQFK